MALEKSHFCLESKGNSMERKEEEKKKNEERRREDKKIQVWNTCLDTCMDLYVFVWKLLY